MSAPTTPAPATRATLTVRVALAAASAVAAIVSCEALARAALALGGDAYSGAGTLARMAAIEHEMTATPFEDAGREDAVGSEPDIRDRTTFKRLLYHLHPYTGYDTAFGMRTAELAVERTAGPAQDDGYDVFVTGGSVATIFCEERRGAIDRLVAGIAEAPEVAGREVRVYRLALPGFKQPQQLVQLCYLFARGCRPELVINLDGLNEIRSSHLNATKEFQPTWPSLGHWSFVTRGPSLDPASLDALLEMRSIAGEARALTERSARWSLHRSALLGRVVMARLREARERWQAAHGRFVAASRAFTESGRSSRYGLPFDGELPCEDLASLWLESSRLMADVCDERGVRYVHFLQPTLHDRGSKPVTPDERRDGIGPRGYHVAVEEGYPLLRDGITELRADGVAAFDTSRVFRDVAETLYHDPAHFDARGNELLAEAMLEELRPLLAEAPR